MSSAARWIWTPLREYVNQHVYFRKCVELPAAPAHARIRLTADTRHCFFINGKTILRGPARGFPHSLPVDEIDIAQYLRPGKNVLAAHVLSYGISTSQNVFRDRAGFYLEGVAEFKGGEIELHTNHTWHCHEAHAYRRHVSRSSAQMAYQEHFDAAHDLSAAGQPDWTQTEYDDSGWHQASVLGSSGVLPWSKLEARGIDFLQTRLVAPVAVSAARDGASKPDSVLFQRTETLTKSAEACKVSLGPVADGQSARLVLDFGETVYGYPILKISGAGGGEIFDLVYSEQPGFGEMDARAGEHGGRAECCLADRLVCRAGANRFETLQPRGFRFLMLRARHIRQPVSIEQLCVLETAYPVVQRGSFSCSDKTLNSIWETGVRTLRHCMADTYMDSPHTQEQGWAAARIAGMTSFHALGDSALYRRGIHLMAESLPYVPEGLLLGVVPSERPDCVLLDYSLHWIASLNEYYRFTGDVAILKEHRHTLEKVLGFFSILSGERGLLGPAPNYSLFLDWAPGLDRGNLSATFNLLYVHALRHAAQIGKVLDDSGLANHCIRQANSLADRIMMVFASSRRSVLFESVDMKTGEPGDVVSQHAIALAVLERVLGKRDYDKTGAVAKVLGDFLPPPGADVARGPVRANLFFRAYVHEALVSLGLGQTAFDDIRRTWGYMLEQGATTWWERLPMKASAARCHAWSTHPTSFLSKNVLGLSPLEPGWKRIAVKPRAFGLTQASGKVPVPGGEIEMAWNVESKKRQVELRVPEGCEAVVDSRVLGAGKHGWEESGEF